MKKLLRAVLCAAMLTCLLLTAAYADTGPKPSVHVDFTGLEGECWATLLSESDSTGPASAWNGDPAHAQHKGNEEWAELDEATWQAFVDYADPDGYYFLQWGWQVSDTEPLHWGYYPPQRFKVLLYFPESGTYLASGILERYAFHSYFQADLTGGTLMPEKDQAASDAAEQAMEIEQRYDYLGEVGPIAARMAITVVLELLLALAFGLWKKGYLLPILAVNLVTQILLNAGLYLFTYRMYYFDFTVTYFVLELLVFAVEAAALCLLLRRREPRPGRGCIVLYAACANMVSFVAGIFLSQVMPGLF